jgi:hypothetical protein
MRRRPLLFHFLLVYGWSFVCFWFAWLSLGGKGGSAGLALLLTGILGSWVGTAIWEVGGLLRGQEARMRRFEEELAKREGRLAADWSSGVLLERPPEGIVARRAGP